jgi:Ca2+-binding EF-hand superfamily protein
MKNFKHYAFAAVLAGVIALPLAAANAESATDKNAAENASGAITSQTFKSLDADKSGSLSESEFSQYSAANVDFKQVDANGDGRLTLSEAQTIPAAPPATPSMAN